MIHKDFSADFRIINSHGAYRLVTCRYESVLYFAIAFTGTTESHMFKEDLQFSGFSYNFDTFEIVDEEFVRYMIDFSGNQKKNTLFLNSNIGIGNNNPISLLHVTNDNNQTDQRVGVTIEQRGEGDAILQLLTTNSQRWVMGIDHSDSNKFKIASSIDLGTDTRLSIDPMTGNVGIKSILFDESGIILPTESNLYINKFRLHESNNNAYIDFDEKLYFRNQNDQTMMQFNQDGKMILNDISLSNRNSINDDISSLESRTQMYNSISFSGNTQGEFFWIAKLPDQLSSHTNIFMNINYCITYKRRSGTHSRNSISSGTTTFSSIYHYSTNGDPLREGHYYSLFQHSENSYYGMGKREKFYYINYNGFGYIGVALSIGDGNNVNYEVRMNIDNLSRTNDIIYFNGNVAKMDMDKITEGITDISHIYPTKGTDDPNWDSSFTDDISNDSYFIYEATLGLKLNNKCSFDGQTFHSLDQNENMLLKLLPKNQSTGGLWIYKDIEGNAEIVNYPKNFDANDETHDHGDLILNSRYQKLRLKSKDNNTITCDMNKVGINKVDPGHTLEVHGSNNVYLGIMEGLEKSGKLILGRTNGVGLRDHAIEVYNDGNTNGAGNYMAFQIHNGTENTDPVERLRIRGDGNVGIGTASPSSTLHVVGNLRVDGNMTIHDELHADKLQVTEYTKFNGILRFTEAKSTSFTSGGGAGNVTESIHMLFDTNRVGSFAFDGNDFLFKIGRGNARSTAFKVGNNRASINSNGLDVNGNMKIYESSGTWGNASNGSLTLEHANSSGVSSIVFKSKNNAGSDFGFIRYQDKRDHSEDSLLTIGTQNDGDDDISFMPSGSLLINTHETKGMVHTASREELSVDGGIYAHNIYCGGSLSIGNYRDSYRTTVILQTAYRELAFYFPGTGIGAYIKGTLNVGSIWRLNFTGQHRSFFPSPELQHYEGLIVSSLGEYTKMSGGVEKGIDAITINESLPDVALTIKENDKSVFGVISTIEETESREDSYGNFVSVTKKEKGDNRPYINSVGEGAIWVTNKNGNIENGDYITSSTIPGYGQLQNDDLLHNYTVAKSTMDCDFHPQLVKKQIIEKRC